MKRIYEDHFYEIRDGVSVEWVYDMRSIFLHEIYIKSIRNARMSIILELYHETD